MEYQFESLQDMADARLRHMVGRYQVLYCSLVEILCPMILEALRNVIVCSLRAAAMAMCHSREPLPVWVVNFILDFQCALK